MNIIATLVIVLCNSGQCDIHEAASWASFGPDAQHACNFVAASLPADLQATCEVTSE